MIKVSTGDEMLNIMLDEGAFLPTRAHEDDAGYDLRSREDAVISPRSNYTFDTGVHMMIPSGYAGFIKSKSGLNVNHNLLSDGLVDASYTGSIRVKLYNHGDGHYIVHIGDKISQIVIAPIYTPVLKEVDCLEETERGSNGFGSTGR